MAGEDEDTRMRELFAQLATQQQELFDTTRTLVDIHKESVIIPGRWVISILVATGLIFFMMCITVAYCFMAGY